MINLLGDHGTEQLQIECCLWTRVAVQALILREYGLELPIRTDGRVSEALGLTVQEPARQVTESDCGSAMVAAGVSGYSCAGAV